MRAAAMTTMSMMSMRMLGSRPLCGIGVRLRAVR